MSKLMVQKSEEEAKSAGEAARLIDELSGAMMCFYPTMRVGQVIDNAITTFQAVHPELGMPDLFYVSNDTLTLALREYVQKFHANRGSKGEKV